MTVRVYKFNGQHYFETSDGLEGKVYIGVNTRGGDSLEYVDHVEIDYDSLYDVVVGTSDYSSEEEASDAIVEYLNENFELITNARELWGE